MTIVGDKGYSTRAVVPTCGARGSARSSRAAQPRSPCFDRVLYRMRNAVERLINRQKQFRRVATNYLAMVTLAAVRL
jgi:transposase